MNFFLDLHLNFSKSVFYSGGKWMYFLKRQQNVSIKLLSYN